jgi:hypothetical protein
MARTRRTAKQAIPRTVKHHGQKAKVKGKGMLIDLGKGIIKRRVKAIKFGVQREQDAEDILVWSFRILLFMWA